MSQSTSRRSLRNIRAIGDEIGLKFQSEGFSSIDLDVIQPAEPFLELSGEDIRRRTYVFTDPYGAELCLRPDLTIPTCLRYLEEGGLSDSGKHKFSYSGSAFRCQNPDSKRPREFYQVGVEMIGSADADQNDVEILVMTEQACQSMGLKGHQIRLGDLSLFTALVDAIDVPDRWRDRIKRTFWRPSEFSRLLSSLSDDTKMEDELLSAFVELDVSGAKAAVVDMLDLADAELIGGRTIEDIATRMMNKALDANSPSLPVETVSLINDYLSIAGEPAQVIGRVESLTKSYGVDLTTVLDRLQRRVHLIAKSGLAQSNVVFATEFGRNLEYYTGFVFEITHASLGSDVQVAGGGRYDNLLSALGATEDTPAVGAMIRVDRLLAALETKKEGRSDD